LERIDLVAEVQMTRIWVTAISIMPKTSLVRLRASRSRVLAIEQTGHINLIEVYYENGKIDSYF